MIKHIVFFNLADEAEGKTRAENAAIIKRDLEALIDIIPELKKIEVGVNHPETPESNWDIALYCKFDSVADLNIYQDHPEHQKVSAYVRKVMTGRACVDYEV